MGKKERKSPPISSGINSSKNAIHGEKLQSHSRQTAEDFSVEAVKDSSFKAAADAAQRQENERAGAEVLL